MAIRFLIISCFVNILLFTGPASAASEQFVIGTGDVIAVDVYNERDLYVRTRIGKDGVIKMPLIGVITVSGKTAKQLESEIESALFDGYLVNPVVTVTVEEYRPFYIKGAVKSAGAYDFEFNLDVDQAIAIAGGLTDRASRKDWFIIRGADKKRIRVDRDTIVQPGDTIEIEESIF